jgi:hypothetical protein
MLDWLEALQSPKAAWAEARLWSFLSMNVDDNSKRFRSRSLQRDLETDQTRLALIKRIVRSAIASTRNELIGLRTRLKNTHKSAASLPANIDNGEIEDGHDSKSRFVDERMLAEERVMQLMRHLAVLQGIENTLDNDSF